MIDVTESAEAVLDIWPYVRQLNEQNIVADSIFNGELVEHVYRTDTDTFDHVLLSGTQSSGGCRFKQLLDNRTLSFRYEFRVWSIVNIHDLNNEETVQSMGMEANCYLVTLKASTSLRK